MYDCSQPLHHQLHRFSIHHRSHRRQPLRVRLLTPDLRHGVYARSHCPRRRLNVAGRSRHRLAESPRLVVAQVRRQDSEVSVGPRYRLPLHHSIRHGRNAAAVRHHLYLLLAHLLTHPKCQAASSAVSGKTHKTTNINVTQLPASFRCNCKCNCN